MRTNAPGQFISNYIFLLSGFTQHAGQDTGMMRLWRRLFRWRETQCPTATMIMPREWDDNIESMAAMVERHAARNQPPQIVIVGYSYGGGWTAPRLARALDRIGHSVGLMVLIDPVWRSRLIGGKWLSFTGSIPVTVPGNVRHVISWRQRNGGMFGPKGSRLRIEDESATRILLETDVSLLELDHTTIQYDKDILATAFRHTIDIIEGPSNEPLASHHRNIHSDRHDLSTAGGAGVAYRRRESA